MKEENLCPFCFTELDKDYNFCPACGEPISEMGKEIFSEHTLNTKLELLTKLTDYVDDEKTLKIIKGLIERV